MLCRVLCGIFIIPFLQPMIQEWSVQTLGLGGQVTSVGLRISLSNTRHMFLKEKGRTLSVFSRSHKTIYYTLYILQYIVYVTCIYFKFVLILCGFSFSTAHSVLKNKLKVNFFRIKLLFSNSVIKYFPTYAGWYWSSREK